MNCFHLLWPHVVKALEATYVSIEIAVVGAIIAWLQLDYAKKRDAKLDDRSQWEKIHRAMVEFRFRREVFNIPGGYGLSDSETAVEVSHALHMLRSELDRAPNSPLVADIWAYLAANAEAEQWRAAAFVPGFDNLVHQVVLKSR